MNQHSSQKHIGRKIWYITAISLSVVILIMSIAGIIGTWIVQNKISQSAVKLLDTVEDTADKLQQAIKQIDRPLAEIEGITKTVLLKTDQISENVSDKGLLLTLLPEDQEKKLVELITTVQDTYDTVIGFINSAIGIYQSINQIPFVNLPLPEQENVESIEETIQDVQSSVQEMLQGISDFRDNASGTIDQVSERIRQASDRLALARDKLFKLDSDLEKIQETARSIKAAIPIIFIGGSILFTILAGFVAYTQVEFISLFVNKWRQLTVKSAVVNASITDQE